MSREIKILKWKWTSGKTPDEEHDAALAELKWASDIIGVLTRIGFLAIGYSYSMRVVIYHGPEGEELQRRWVEAILTITYFSLALFLVLPLYSYAMAYCRKLHADDQRAESLYVLKALALIGSIFRYVFVNMVFVVMMMAIGYQAYLLIFFKADNP